MGRIFITGMGIISSIGNTVDENRQALIHGKCGIDYEMNLFETKYAQKLPFGTVKKSTQKIKDKFSISQQNAHRTSLLALHATSEAINDSQLTKQQLTQENTAYINATTVGGMCLTDELYNDSIAQTICTPYITAYDTASVALFIQAHFNFDGVVNTINTACSSAANAIMYGARLIENGFAKRAIVGGVDSLAKFTINGFNALHILSPEKCKPFDKNRNGLNLGEGAAFLVLEKEEDCKNKKVYASLNGFSNTNDAYHASALSPMGIGPQLAMEQALQKANLIPQQIDFINAHGTGTENNDEVESVAMLSVFKKVPPFASTKSNVGHTLGASGAIEAVFSILNIIHQEVYAQLNFNETIDGTGLQPITEYAKTPIRHVMSNSFGFGGNCSTLIFSAL